MALKPEDIIEAVIDELVVGEIGEGIPNIEIKRTGPGSLFLDYGSNGRFTLLVAVEPSPG